MAQRILVLNQWRSTAAFAVLREQGKEFELRGKYAPHQVITGEKSNNIVVARSTVAAMFGRAT